MRKSLAIRRNILPVEHRNPMSGTMLIGIALIALVIWLILKNRQSIAIGGQYKNLETWAVSYNSDGLPTKIEIHRDAQRS